MPCLSWSPLLGLIPSPRQVPWEVRLEASPASAGVPALKVVVEFPTLAFSSLKLSAVTSEGSSETMQHDLLLL